jgi:hypothetical protein
MTTDRGYAMRDVLTRPDASQVEDFLHRFGRSDRSRLILGDGIRRRARGQGPRRGSVRAQRRSTSWVRVTAEVQPRPGRTAPAVGRHVAGGQIKLRPGFRSSGSRSWSDRTAFELFLRSRPRITSRFSVFQRSGLRLAFFTGYGTRRVPTTMIRPDSKSGR